MSTDRIAIIGDKLKKAKKSDDFWNTCLKVFENLGVAGIGYGVVPMRSLVTEGSITEASFFRHSYLPEWERAIGSNGLLDSDNISDQLLQGCDEIDWNKDPTEFGPTYTEKYLHELERDLGMIWGKSLSLSRHPHDQISSGMGLHVSCVKSDDEFHKYWAEHSAEIRTIAEMLNTGLLGQHKDALVRLTGREKDYLYWSAMGLDRIETAGRLGISENTLDKPIASAKAKLKARNTSQAVAKAVLLDLINL